MFYDDNKEGILFDVSSVEPITSVPDSFLQQFSSAIPCNNEVLIEAPALGFDSFEEINGSSTFKDPLPIATLTDSEIALSIFHGEFTLESIYDLLPLARVSAISQLLESF